MNLNELGWPLATLGGVAQLRILAAGLAQPAFTERTIAAPFDEVWAIASDMERGVPLYESGLRRVEILEQAGERLRVRATGPFGIRGLFDACLRPGFCVMRGRLGQLGFAAAPSADGTATHFAHFEAPPLALSFSRKLVQRKIESEVATLAQLCER